MSDVNVVIILVFLGLVVLRGLLVAIGAALLVRPVVECPACFGSTLGLHRRWLIVIAPWLEWRWCPHCGWTGPARRIKTNQRLDE